MYSPTNLPGMLDVRVLRMFLLFLFIITVSITPYSNGPVVFQTPVQSPLYIYILFNAIDP